MRSDSVIEAILFDMDGVIIESSLDVSEIKRAIFGRPDVFIIEGINSLPEHERLEAWRKVEQMEIAAAETANIYPEALELLGWMDEQNLLRGIVTRNCRASTEIIRMRIGRDLGVIIAREDAEPKPAPDGVHLALQKLGVSCDATLMVGDFTFDIEAGHRAGCRTVFLRTEKFAELETNADFEVNSLLEIPDIVKELTNG